MPWCSVKIDVGAGFRFKRHFGGGHIQDPVQGQFIRDAKTTAWDRLTPAQRADFTNANALPTTQVRTNLPNDPGDDFEEIR